MSAFRDQAREVLDETTEEGADESRVEELLDRLEALVPNAPVEELHSDDWSDGYLHGTKMQVAATARAEAKLAAIEALCDEADRLRAAYLALHPEDEGVLHPRLDGEQVRAILRGDS